MRKLVTIWIWGWLFTASSYSQDAGGSNTERPLPEYTSVREIDRAMRMVRSVWDGDGRVIVGKIAPLPLTSISARVPVRGGRFTASVAGGRTLTFYAHGYDKLVVDSLDEIRDRVVDAGVIKFAKTPD
ncbi:MAG: hypothetical protein AAF226_08785, partial [Verrucomicrobiota bacterium]